MLPNRAGGQGAEVLHEAGTTIEVYAGQADK